MTEETDLERQIRRALLERSDRVPLVHAAQPAPGPGRGRRPHRRSWRVAAPLVAAGVAAAVVLGVTHSSAGPTTVRVVQPATTPAPPVTAPPTRPAPTTSAPPTTAPPSAAVPAPVGVGTAEPTTSPAATGPVVLLPCQPQQIAVALAATTGSGTDSLYAFSVVNRSTATCAVGGYVGVEVLDQAGQVISDQVARGPRTPGTGHGVSPVTLVPGGAASFTVGISDVPPAGSTCPVIGSFSFIPPDSTTSLSVALSATPTAQDCGSPEVFPTGSGTAGQP